MATKTQVITTITCDKCTSETTADNPGVRFSWNKTGYRTDLCKKHFDEVSAFMSDLVGSSEKDKDAPRQASLFDGRAKGRSRSSENTARIREWAKANGYSVKATGSIPADVRKAFAAAQSG